MNIQQLDRPAFAMCSVPLTDPTSNLSVQLSNCLDSVAPLAWPRNKLPHLNYDLTPSLASKTILFRSYSHCSSRQVPAAMADSQSGTLSAGALKKTSILQSALKETLDSPART